MAGCVVEAIGDEVAVALELEALLAPGAGHVEVSYLEPDHFNDIGLTPRDRDDAMASLSAYLQSLAAQLPDGQTLKLQFTDIALAGRQSPFRLDGVRVMRGGADWPRLTFHYTLHSGEHRLADGEVELSDMNYLADASFLDPRLGSFGFEKHLLQRWFATTFKAP